MTDQEPLLEKLKTGKPMLSDGAIGTMLHSRGITFEGCFDCLNLSQPGLVADPPPRVY